MPAAVCGSVSMLTMGLPANTAMPAEKSHLPKAAVVGKAPISAKLKQRFVNDLASITLLGLLRPANTGAIESGQHKEILVLGLQMNSMDIPTEIIERIAAQRASDILFVCVRNGADEEGNPQEQCALGIRRSLPVKPGHTPQFIVHAGAWLPADQQHLQLVGGTMEDVWNSLGAQIILGTTDGSNLDQRIAIRNQISLMESEEIKLVKAHQRAKNPAQRNEIYTKLHRVRTQLASLRGNLN